MMVLLRRKGIFECDVCGAGTIGVQNWNSGHGDVKSALQCPNRYLCHCALKTPCEKILLDELKFAGFLSLFLVLFT